MKSSLKAVKLKDSHELRRYLAHRLETFLACLSYNGNEVIPEPFYRYVETSEKGALSFVAGCLGAHIGARHWLNAGGADMLQFLHVGIYSKACTVLPSALIELGKVNKKGKSPDFLVKQHYPKTGGAIGWHIFESKGGGRYRRWLQVVEGLQQLDNISTVKQAGSASASTPLTKVCVQTSLTPNKPISVALVDPPSNGPDKPPTAPDAPSDGATISLIKGIPEMLVALEVLDWFYLFRRAATDDMRQPQGIDGWKLVTSAAFGGLTLGVPELLLKAEHRLRKSAASYFLVQDTLEALATNADIKSGAAPRLPSERAFTNEFNRALGVHLQFPEFSWAIQLSGQEVYAQIKQKLDGSEKSVEGALHAWAKCLTLEDWEEELAMIHSDAEAQPELQRRLLVNENCQLTEAGLFVELMRGEAEGKVAQALLI